MPRSRAAADIPGLSTLPFTKPLFSSPHPAGRQITAGFSYVQRIGKSAAVDVWFPKMLQEKLNALIEGGAGLDDSHFPAEWAAVRQFELLQEAGNYKIYDMDATHLKRTLVDLSRNMRAGGYRVTVATVGGYSDECAKDELEILDRRLQDRLSKLIHMLYLEEQSATINKEHGAALSSGTWDYRTALPHVGVALGARDVFRPTDGTGNIQQTRESVFIPGPPYEVTVAHADAWVGDMGVSDSVTGAPFVGVGSMPAAGQYRVSHGTYRFAREDCGREVHIAYMHNAGGGAPKELSISERKHKLAKHFFDILSILPQNHVLHDTAVGLQLPEMISENEWIYLAPSDETLGMFNRLLNDLFTPFDKISLAGLDGRADAGPEPKASAQHMRGYGDRLTAESDRFYRNLAQFSL